MISKQAHELGSGVRLYPDLDRIHMNERGYPDGEILHVSHAFTRRREVHIENEEWSIVLIDYLHSSLNLIGDGLLYSMHNAIELAITLKVKGEFHSCSSVREFSAQDYTIIPDLSNIRSALSFQI